MQRKGKVTLLIAALLLILLVSQVYAKAPDAGTIIPKHPTGTQVVAQPEEDHGNKPDKPDKPAKPDKPGKPDQTGKPDKDQTTDDEDQSEKPGKKLNFHGVIAAVSADSITLTLKDDSSVTIAIDADTKVQIPGAENVENAALAADMNAVVQAVEKDGGYLALRIHVAPGKPEHIHRVGVVVAYTASSITVENKKGEQTTFVITADTIILPAERADQLVEGATVTIISPRDVTGNMLIAKGIVVHPEKQEDDSD